MGRFWIAVVIGAVAVAGLYDVPAGDYVGDRIFIVCALLLVALAFPGEARVPWGGLMRQHGVRQVPLLFCLSIAASLLGASLLAEPTLSERSAALSVMPVWGVLLWGAVFLGGGASTVHGLRADRLDYESAGCTLQGFAYLAAAIVTVFSDSIPPSPLGIAFTAALAAGFIWRGFIVRGG